MIGQDQFLAFIARLCLVLLFPFSALNKIFDIAPELKPVYHAGGVF